MRRVSADSSPLLCAVRSSSSTSSRFCASPESIWPNRSNQDRRSGGVLFGSSDMRCCGCATAGGAVIVAWLGATCVVTPYCQATTGIRGGCLLLRFGCLLLTVIGLPLVSAEGGRVG